MKKIARRIIDIPDDARPMDVLALRHIFSVDEIEDSGLHVKVLDAQSELTRSLESASATLRDYGFEQAELIVMAEAKIKEHSNGLKQVLFCLKFRSLVCLDPADNKIFLIRKPCLAQLPDKTPFVFSKFCLPRLNFLSQVVDPDGVCCQLLFFLQQRFRGVFFDFS